MSQRMLYKYLLTGMLLVLLMPVINAKADRTRMRSRSGHFVLTLGSGFIIRYAEIEANKYRVIVYTEGEDTFTGSFATGFGKTFSVSDSVSGLQFDVTYSGSVTVSGVIGSDSEGSEVEVDVTVS